MFHYNIQGVCVQEKTSSRKPQSRTLATQAALMQAARTLFVQQGYAATGTPEIVAAAQVTRGALYHHFEDKSDLFFAVARQMAQEVASAVEDASTDAAAPLEALLAGAQGYFQAMAEHGRAQLLLLQAPAILSPQQLAQLSDLAGAAQLQDGLRQLLIAKKSALDPAELQALTQIVSAMFDRVATALAQNEDITVHQAVLSKLLVSLKEHF